MQVTSGTHRYRLTFVALISVLGIWSLPTLLEGAVWVSGPKLRLQPGVYGTKGVASPANVPGSRAAGRNSWIDGAGNLWLFGGFGKDDNGIYGRLNDLWKFDGVNWTWVSGAKVKDQAGAYGTQGVANSANVPGSRSSSVSWTDASGNFWLFGGTGFDKDGTQGSLNDLWKFDGANWAWVSGAKTVNQLGVYGSLGVAHADNVPGARWGSISWIDAAGNLWLFGGRGYDSAGGEGSINDLWKFDGVNWTWVSGSDTKDHPGVYGSLGVAHADNVPGARQNGISWIDSSGNLWLFGGAGYYSAGSTGTLNDLWRFDGANWTWVSGSNTKDQPGVYGSIGVAHADNVPGARWGGLAWIDSADNLWLFGGYYIYNPGSIDGTLSDMWKFDGANWTWVTGASTINQLGVYGDKGVADPANLPGARYGGVSWIDADGNMWLFGGVGYDSSEHNIGYLNDLWKFVGFRMCELEQQPVGDNNGDCLVDLRDVALMALHWLEDTGILSVE